MLADARVCILVLDFGYTRNNVPRYQVLRTIEQSLKRSTVIDYSPLNLFMTICYDFLSWF